MTEPEKQVFLEEIALLRAEAGHCASLFDSVWLLEPVRCRKARTHEGKHRAFGVGGIGRADEDGHLLRGYWFQEW